MANARSLGKVGFGLSALLCVFAATSCGGAKGGSDDGGEEGGGTSGTAGTSGTTSTGGTSGTSGGTAGTPSGGTAGMGGTAGTPSGGTAGDVTGGTGGAECTPNPPIQTCSGATLNMHMPADGVAIDFATYNADSGVWGDMAMGDLTGGTSPYPPENVITRAVEGGALRLTASLPPYSAEAGAPPNYAGLVFWFGPCVNASAYDGITLNTGGSLGGAVMQFQIQTYLDYPAEPENSKGGCVFTDCGTKWTECKGPELVVTVPAKPEDVNFPFSMFVGGSPEDGVTSEGIVGLQIEFECQAMETCAIDVTLGGFTFTTG